MDTTDELSAVHGKIGNNLTQVQTRIAAAAVRGGREAGEVRLVAVTKSASVEQAIALYALGIRDFGENRLETARPKMAALPGDVRWHMLAPVQRRKAKDIVALFHSADAIDRIEAAEALQKRCDERDCCLDVLIEVNVSGETQKHGFAPEALDAALAHLRQFERLKVTGLMTMAPFEAEPAVIRAIFRRTRALAVEAGLPEISMGMSDDFELAVEEGATQVRLGRILFE